MLIEAAPNDATRILEELGSATNKRFRVEWMTEVSSDIELLRRGRVRAGVLDLPLRGRHCVETFDHISEVATHVPRLILSGADTEDMVPQAIQGEARNYLDDYYAGGCRLRQRCAQ